MSKHDAAPLDCLHFMNLSRTNRVRLAGEWKIFTQKNRDEFEEEGFRNDDEENDPGDELLFVRGTTVTLR